MAQAQVGEAGLPCRVLAPGGDQHWGVCFSGFALRQIAAGAVCAGAELIADAARSPLMPWLTRGPVGG
ncbi:hypothetical protein G6F68_016574 [Rhizopus microsporus]|nr:hypothetical protein G6F68_016574 [Rhizopus microsporus]